jgi:asparagine synthase (glutamine-hydrolysing)
MGPQDGVDRALRAIEVLVHRLGRTDCHFAFVGRGDALEDMRRLATQLRLDDWVTFTGWIEDDLAFAYLSTADVGLSPDPPSPLNDVSTMNKTMEYMAFAVPVVAFDLHETRVSAGEAALYAVPDDVRSFAELVDELLGDPARRAELGAVGRRRIEDTLAWSHQREDYVGVYRLLLGSPPPPDRLGHRPNARTGSDGEPSGGLRPPFGHGGVRS